MRGRMDRTQFSRSRKCARPRAMTQRSPWIRFALPALVREPRGFGLTSGLLWPDAALEQSSNRSPQLGSAAASPVGVSRHLVSTSVQFGQLAAGKTESDQWPLVAELSGNQSGST